MAIRQDYILRQINMLVDFVAKVFFNKKTVSYEIQNENELSPSDIVYKKIHELTQEGKICEAEDLLFDSIDTADSAYLAIACLFYEKLNTMSDEELEKANFSREEINEGLNSVIKKYGIALP